MTRDVFQLTGNFLSLELYDNCDKLQAHKCEYHGRKTSSGFPTRGIFTVGNR